nr:hypothetical protein [Burkholderia ambifaria]
MGRQPLRTRAHVPDQHYRPDGSTSVDTVVEADNLDAKLHKWHHEGFARRDDADGRNPAILRTDLRARFVRSVSNRSAS